jgi:hypothetical protein
MYELVEKQEVNWPRNFPQAEKDFSVDNVQKLFFFLIDVQA